MQESNIIRIADRSIGKIICQLLTFFEPLRKFFFKNDHNKKPRFLIIELFEMGASIMISPSIYAIKESYPDAEIHVLTTDSCVPSWNALAQIPTERIHAISSKSLSVFIASFFVTILNLRKTSFSVILDFGLFTRITAILSGLLKAHSRGGFHKTAMEGLYRGDFYDLKCSFNQNRHISLNFMALTRMALESQLKQDQPGPKIFCDRNSLKIPAHKPKASRALIEQKFLKDSSKQYLVLSPDVGPTLSVRNYPKDSFVKLVNLITDAYPNYQILLVGTNRDFDTSQWILENALHKGKLTNLCGKTSFTELLDLLSYSELVISNDNGVAHFAALVRRPSVAIFSTDSPFIYGPIGDCAIVYSFFHCSPCIMAFNHKNSLCSDNKCLQSISPSTIFNFVNRHFQGSFPKGTINGTIPYLV